MQLTVTSWNINSVRLRIGMVGEFLTTHAPDVLCLQETKTPDEQFPAKAFHQLGYVHQAFIGQKGYNGVAIVSKLPFSEKEAMSMCGRNDARHMTVTLDKAAGPAAGIAIHNFYIPAGGDIPDPELNPKFAHKLAFLDEVTAWPALATAAADAGRHAVVVGDLNIAPLETDVWGHKQLLNVVSHTPVEVEKLNRFQASGPWVDVMRSFVPPQDKLFTWWSYRSPDYTANDRGRRLDHVWASHSLAPSARAMTVLKDARGWEKPSDHVPVALTFG